MWSDKGSSRDVALESVDNIIIIGLNKIYSFIVIISSTNKYRKHKSSMLVWVLPVIQASSCALSSLSGEQRYRKCMYYYYHYIDISIIAIENVCIIIIIITSILTLSSLQSCLSRNCPKGFPQPAQPAFVTNSSTLPMSCFGIFQIHQGTDPNV